MVPQVVKFPRILTLFLQLMQSSKVGVQLAISKEALARSVAHPMKEAIAQRMVSSARF